jgi:hypothetical protein
MPSLFPVKEIGLPVFPAIGLEEAEEGRGVQVDGAGGGREGGREGWVSGRSVGRSMNGMRGERAYLGSNKG